MDGRYRIDAHLGAGGVGAVYAGTQVALGRPVAIKILHEGVHASFTQRFEREAKALAALRHPNIVAVTDYGVCEDIPYLVMELLEGETLAYRLLHGPLPPERVLTLTRQLLRAVGFVHEQGLVHRDLKPGNLFLERLPDGEQRLKLLDFGLAKFMQGDPNSKEPAVTRAGDIVGTPAYIAPEQVAGDTVDARADTYGTGVMLFQMLSGRVPFEGEPVEQLKSHLVAPVPLLRDANPQLRPRSEVDVFLQRAMAKQREARFQTCTDMLAALEAIPRPWLLAPDGRTDQALASTLLSPGPHNSLDQPTVLRKDGGGESMQLLVRHVRAYSTAALALLSLLAMAAAAAIILSRARPASAPAAAGAAPVQRPPAIGVPPPTRGSSVRVTVPAAPPPAPEAPVAAGAAAVEETAQVAVVQPNAVEPDPAAAAQQPVRPPARNPWSRPAPQMLRNLRKAVLGGERGNERTVTVLRKYNRNYVKDPRGHLLLAQFYMNRDWREDALSQYAIAYDLDPTVRGAPEMLRDLLKLVAQGDVAERAAILIRRAYGREALPAIDRSITALVGHGPALARMAALRAAVSNM